MVMLDPMGDMPPRKKKKSARKQVDKIVKRKDDKYFMLAKAFLKRQKARRDAYINADKFEVRRFDKINAGDPVFSTSDRGEVTKFMIENKIYVDSDYAIIALLDGKVLHAFNSDSFSLTQQQASDMIEKHLTPSN